MKPITRKEYYLAKAAGTYTGPTPPPVLREDYYLATLAGDYSGNCPAPVTRIEKYMSAAAGLTSYVPQPVTRVEKYWYAIAKGMGYVPEPVTREEKFLYAILKNPPKPEYLDKTAEGSLVLLPDSAEAPFTALTIYGHSTQSGTPSPDNPVPIVSAGEYGHVEVEVLGGNLVDESTFEFPPDYWKYENGVFETEEGQSTYIYKEITLCPGYYTFSADCISINGTGKIQVRNGSEILYRSTFDNVGRKSISFEAKEEILYKILIGDNGNGAMSFMNIMLNAGSTPLPYMPYKTPQTLTAQTPGGLPGIPVSSGGNYTDEFGQQWICDEIDFKRGKYVQRVGKEILNGNNNWVKSSDIGTDGSSCYYFSQLSSSEIKLITHFRKGAAYISQCSAGEYVPFDSILYLMSNIPTLDEFKSWINEEDVTEYYALATPIETDLPAEEIAAYKALHTYSPTTTVSNDAEAWMKVGYKATP